VCRFQTSSSFAKLSPQQNIQYARTVEKASLAEYINGGGLPPIIGETALAGGHRGSCLLPQCCAKHFCMHAWGTCHITQFANFHPDRLSRT